MDPKLLDEWLDEMTSTELTDEEGMYIIKRVLMWVRQPSKESESVNARPST